MEPPAPAPRVGAIIVAAGAGERMAGVDKIFAPILGRPLVAWTVSAFEQCPAVDEIVLAVHRSTIQQGRALAQAEGWRKLSQVCRGGPRRQDSVREALWRLGKCDWVVIHDGDRPCIVPDLILRGLSAARETGAAVPGIPVYDTVKRTGSDGLVAETLDRAGLWLIQTPQVFAYGALWAAHEAGGADATDDAALLERRGHAVSVFPGSPDNLKVTVPADLETAAEWLYRRATPPLPEGQG